MGLYDALDGYAYEIDDDVFRVVKEIQDRFPTLKLMYLNEDTTVPISLRDAPYVIVDRDKTGNEYVVLRVWNLDRSVIDKLYQMQEATVADFDKAQAVEAAARKALADEKRAEGKDVMLHVFKNPKTTYTFKNKQGELIKVQDG